MENTHVISIDMESVRKGDVIAKDVVLQHFINRIEGAENFELKKQEFNSGIRNTDPTTYAPQRVAEEVMKRCAERGYPVVCKVTHGAVHVLTDEQAMHYRNSKANSALAQHRKQVRSLHTDIDQNNLSGAAKRQLESMKNHHTMIELAISSGKKTLKEMSKGRVRLSPKAED